jgi:PLP dependent protein
MEIIRQNIERIQNEIAEAALRSGRNPAAVRLMAVTKTVDAVRIEEAIGAGVRVFGENYVQEAKGKIEGIGKREIEWHMIGYLQSNKAKYAVHLFNMIHSVSKTSQAAELDRRSAALDHVMEILVEVNLSAEPSKSGLEPSAVIPFIKSISGLRNISIRGLMTMPPWFDDAEEARPYFQKLRELSLRIAEEAINGVVMRDLSMGMTQDYQVAVEEGATIVRIGRGIFGERKQQV